MYTEERDLQMTKATQELLLQVAKPARYIGNEVNMVKKEPGDVSVRFAFCFPDVYEVGMSHLGLQILYYFLNRRSDTYCERVFAPWVDMEILMRENNIPLFSLETGTDLKSFDFAGFTLQYEMSYTNIINMLDLSNIPIYSCDRGEDDPIVIAGGPCAYNPEPLAEIMDCFYIGEGEVKYDEIMEIYKEHKENGGSRAEFLEKLLKVEGIYVPRFYDVGYKENGEIRYFKPTHPDAGEVIKKVIVNDLNGVFYPEKQLVPLIETVHDRVQLEVFRGCMRGCRFCQAGYIYRPVREKNYDTLIDNSKSLIETSGHEEISLVSLSTVDYTHFKELAEGIMENFSKDYVNISLPSLRIDAFSLEMMERIQGVRKGGLTFAPEAGTQRLRNVINKGLTEEEILNGAKLAFCGGYNRIKLYFMTGLPTETYDDLCGIAKLSEAIVGKYFEIPKENRSKGVNVVVSASCFVPKPFTPFQWEAQNTHEEFLDKHKYVKKSISRRQIKYNYHDVKLSVVEGVISRGDRRVSRAIVKAWEMGAKFDGWSEHFKFDIWEKAFLDSGLDYKFYSCRKRALDEILPWDHIDIGVSKEFFIDEYKKSIEEQTTENCRTACAGCGANSFGGGVCYEV